MDLPAVIWKLKRAVYGLNGVLLKWCTVYEHLSMELILSSSIQSKLDVACEIYKEEGQAGMA